MWRTDPGPAHWHRQAIASVPQFPHLHNEDSNAKALGGVSATKGKMVSALGLANSGYGGCIASFQDRVPGLALVR